ncbi:MAG: hypothetical protein HKO79_14620 [Desulfobacterales bacterium]|nr:hypothetical protein [Desulfobacterales bacterium]NNL43717.1 hypothetical protein [Desulfobacterales bacterium]
MILNKLKKVNLWIAFMALVSNFLTYTWWSDYLKLGYVYDGKHGIAFEGDQAFGHLIGISLLALISNYFLIASVYKAFKNR